MSLESLIPGAGPIGGMFSDGTFGKKCSVTTWQTESPMWIVVTAARSYSCLTAVAIDCETGGVALISKFVECADPYSGPGRNLMMFTKGNALHLWCRKAQSHVGFCLILRPWIFRTAHSVIIFIPPGSRVNGSFWSILRNRGRLLC